MLFLNTQIKSLHASAITNPQKQYRDPKVKLPLLTLVPLVADKRRESRACPSPFLRKTRIKLHHLLPTNTKEHVSMKKRSSTQDQQIRRGGLAPRRAESLLYHLL
ncbi:hypothetical protein AXF42_Ash001029 [Apostasia shenzhenica]|uniref:Uncharacterized protein n=1 Tax=Apostasia shenzhenica TaxID=1088818 RepID=A0A2I0ATU5_9ASPA|nr:hypothetical protein AXF42_Ash001029 [Apostasia shenzhenica]